MSLKKSASKLYLVNLALLATHEIDSAFWHEWNLFGLPGGIDLFLVLNFILILVFIFGFESVINWDKNAFIFSILLSIVGIFAFVIHSYFILSGHPEFKSDSSLAILYLVMLVSIGQLTVTIMIKRKENTGTAAG